MNTKLQLTAVPRKSVNTNGNTYDTSKTKKIKKLNSKKILTIKIIKMGWLTYMISPNYFNNLIFSTFNNDNFH